MSTIEWKDDFIEGFVSEGLAKGMAQGRELGAVSAKIADLLKVLGARDLHPTKKQLAQVAACTDLGTLDRWFDRSLTAATAAEVFED